MTSFVNSLSSLLQLFLRVNRSITESEFGSSLRRFSSSSSKFLVSSSESLGVSSQSYFSMSGFQRFQMISLLKEVTLRVLPMFQNLQNSYLLPFDLIQQPSSTRQFSSTTLGCTLQFLRMMLREILAFSPIVVFWPMNRLLESRAEGSIFEPFLMTWLYYLIENLASSLLSSFCLGCNYSCLWMVQGDKQPQMQAMQHLQSSEALLVWRAFQFCAIMYALIFYSQTSLVSIPMMNSFMVVYSQLSLKLLSTSTVQMKISQGTMSLLNSKFTFFKFIFSVFICRSWSIDCWMWRISPVLELRMWIFLEKPSWKADVRTTDLSSSFFKKCE